MKNHICQNYLYRVICTLLCVFLLAGTAFGTAFALQVSSADLSGTEAERIILDPVSQSVSYSAVVYNNTNGLPTSEANAIVQTAEGAIWIGSYGGLIRYDGNTFERMDPRMTLQESPCKEADNCERDNDE